MALTNSHERVLFNQIERKEWDTYFGEAPTHWYNTRVFHLITAINCFYFQTHHYSCFGAVQPRKACLLDLTLRSSTDFSMRTHFPSETSYQAMMHLIKKHEKESVALRVQMLRHVSKKRKKSASLGFGVERLELKVLFSFGVSVNEIEGSLL